MSQLEEKKWREQDGIVYLTLVNKRTTGGEIAKEIGDHHNSYYGDYRIDHNIGDIVKNFVTSPEFEVSSAASMEIAILSGHSIEGCERYTSPILGRASRLNFRRPNAEVAYLLCKEFTCEDLKLMRLTHVVVMHKPFKDHRGYQWLLDAGRYGGVGLSHPSCPSDLGLGIVDPNGSFEGWNCDTGFAFLR